VGDQFALMEAVVSMAVLLKRYTFTAVPGHDVGMTTGATIHTQNGLFMTVNERAPTTSLIQKDLATAAL
jgi:carotene epsilon-monooxygenase